MATLEKLAVEREKLCRMDLNDPGILAQSRIVDELSGGDNIGQGDTAEEGWIQG